MSTWRGRWPVIPSGLGQVPESKGGETGGGGKRAGL